jgi:hypothetical protein
MKISLDSKLHNRFLKTFLNKSTIYIKLDDSSKKSVQVL